MRSFYSPFAALEDCEVHQLGSLVDTKNFNSYLKLQSGSSKVFSESFDGMSMSLHQAISAWGQCRVIS